MVGGPKLWRRFHLIREIKVEEAHHIRNFWFTANTKENLTVLNNELQDWDL